MTRSCTGCGKSITRKSKKGLCHGCSCADPAVRAKKGQLSPEQRARRAAAARALSADPAIVAKRSAKGKETFQRPEVRERHHAACMAAQERMDPAVRERQREAGRNFGKHNLAQTLTPECRKRVGEAIRRARLAWCPEQHWPLNEKLKRTGVRLAERKVMIAEMIAAQERNRLAAMTPFERQLERVAAGAKLIEVRPIRRSEPTMTLGGVPSGLL